MYVLFIWSKVQKMFLPSSFQSQLTWGCLGLAVVCWGFFLIEGEEVIAPIPPRVRDRAAVDRSGVMGNSTATCSQSHSYISTSASWLYTNCGWKVRFPLYLHLYCLLNPSTQMLNSVMQLAEPGWASSFVVAEFCGSCTRMTGAFL